MTAEEVPPKQIGVGVGVFVLNAARTHFVIGKRVGSVGSGTYALAGGHLEFGESFASCAEREALEETGLVVKELKYLTACNTVMESEGKHYVTIFMSGVVDAGVEPKLMEPEKCEGWEWATWDELKAEVLSGSSEKKFFLPFSILCREQPEFRPDA